jgi:hypothetical protein
MWRKLTLELAEVLFFRGLIGELRGGSAAWIDMETKWAQTRLESLLFEAKELEILFNSFLTS